MLTLGIICGGMAGEKGISLNSARSIMDHIDGVIANVTAFYMNENRKIFPLSKENLYSNTPMDFQFQLNESRDSLSPAKIKHAFSLLDIVFPIIHGPIGEDGELQRMLESMSIPYIGSSPEPLQAMFYKHNAVTLLKKWGYPYIPTLYLSKEDTLTKEKFDQFMIAHTIDTPDVIVKPTDGGSSVLVEKVQGVDAINKMHQIIVEAGFQGSVIEPFLKNAQEFTVIVVQKEGKPVALIPSSVELLQGDLFNYRKKYLPTAETIWHCPADFSIDVINRIRHTAEELFTKFGGLDLVRFDGWVFHKKDIVFADINPISGMEQNSFLFQQSTRVGLSHLDILTLIMSSATHRYGMPFQIPVTYNAIQKKQVRVLFGGNTDEREVSVMSGTNVWLKLLKSHTYAPEPYLLDTHLQVWKLPYTYALNHTVEEIMINCEHLGNNTTWQPLVNSVRGDLGLPPYHVKDHLPEKMSIEMFIENTKGANAFCFLGLHGGIGEEGTLQAKLERAHVPYNGSPPTVAALGMDKVKTGHWVDKANILGLTSLHKYIVPSFPRTTEALKVFWDGLPKKSSYVIKPVDKGCSTGVVIVNNWKNFARYFEILQSGANFVEVGELEGSESRIELVVDKHADYFLEPYVEVDPIAIHNHNIVHTQKTHFVEISIGVLEENGHIQVMYPSITIAKSGILSLEEKFQGGTGVNLTPPPNFIISAKQLHEIQHTVTTFVKKFGIKNYVRIDFFYNYKKNTLILIEVNILPGLTPATVFYQQAVNFTPSLFPVQLLSQIIRSALKAHETI